MEQTEATFDSRLAIKQAGGNVDLAKELFEMFTTELPTYSSDISELFQKKDYVSLCNVVHKLHGATRYCGVPALSIKTSAFESALKNGHQEKYPELLNNLLTEIKLIEQTKDDFKLE